MAFSVKTHPLSSLSAVKFVYNYGELQPLASEYVLFGGGFGYYKHEAFKAFKDTAISKKNYLVLTEAKPLSSVFNLTNSLQTNTFNNTLGTVFLKMDGKDIVEADGIIYKGGIGGCGNSGTKLMVNVAPISGNLVELRVGNSKYIKVDQQYPYTARLVGNVFDPSEYSTRRFKMEYANGKATFSIYIPDAVGYRYLAFNNDGILRAVGLELNETILNNYHFDVVEITKTSTQTTTTKYGYVPLNTEVKYFNNFYDSVNLTNVELKEIADRNTNLLISCPTHSITNGNSEVNVNISLLKTNFSSEGIYRQQI